MIVIDKGEIAKLWGNILELTEYAVLLIRS